MISKNLFYIKSLENSFLITLLLLITVTTNAQSLHNIRFIHSREEFHPIGTISIAVEKLVPPRDKMTDFSFGKAVKTDSISFYLIANYIKTSKYVHPTFKERAASPGLYEIIVIIDSTKEQLYVVENDYNLFFAPLKILLKNKCRDKKVIDVFKYLPLW
jgi:hypothetical protein